MADRRRTLKHDIPAAGRAGRDSSRARNAWRPVSSSVLIGNAATYASARWHAADAAASLHSRQDSRFDSLRCRRRYNRLAIVRHPCGGPDAENPAHSGVDAVGDKDCLCKAPWARRHSAGEQSTECILGNSPAGRNHRRRESRSIEKMAQCQARIRARQAKKPSSTVLLEAGCHHCLSPAACKGKLVAAKRSESELVPELAGRRRRRTKEAFSLSEAWR